MSIRERWNNGPPLILEDNNIEGAVEGTGNIDEIPKFPEDGFVGSVGSIHFDPLRMITTLVPQKLLKGSENLSGRVIRVGERWSVIKAMEKGNVIVWGDVNAEDQEKINIHVIPSYGR